ncbi:MAG: SAM-dependent DNA methyltransferase, partial [Gilvibacter sp.]|nr:SAM-dependent DNA methyltransferase [Gilvibacter sp.]
MINAQRQHIDQFYATPLEVARKALEGIDLKGIKTVLDPSCGTGAFLDQLRIYQGKY